MQRLGAAASAACPYAVAGSLAAVVVAQSTLQVDGRTTFTLFDDAMVSMRYARNLVEGHGLVWNAGGEAVEGYTNLGWTLWMAVLHAGGWSGNVTRLLVTLSGLATVIGTIAVCSRLARTLGVGLGGRMVALLLVATSYPLVFWSARGMEVGLVALLLAGAAACSLSLLRAPTLGRAAALGVLGAVAVLVRDDVVVPLAPLLAVPLVRHRRALVLLPGLAVASAFAAHVALRLAIYGSSVPNTYDLKLGGVPLDDRLSRGLAVVGLQLASHLALPIALAAVAIARRRLPGAEAALLAGPALMAGLYAAYVGGDAWEFIADANRYLAPTLPLLYLISGAGAASLASDGRPQAAARRAAAVLAGCALLVLVVPWDRAHLALPSGSAGALAAATAAAAAAVGLVAVRPPRSAARALALLGAAAITATSAATWARYGGGSHPHARADAGTVELAAALDPFVGPGDRVAVVWAGTLPYELDDVEMIDLLGKSDRHVAASPPHDIAFRPGHNKWDYGYSIGVLRPTVVVGLWQQSTADIALLGQRGYVRVARSIYVLPGASRPAGPIRHALGTVELPAYGL